MREELVAIEKNKTWRLIALPANKKKIDLKWDMLREQYRYTKQGW